MTKYPFLGKFKPNVPEDDEQADLFTGSDGEGGVGGEGESPSQGEGGEEGHTGLDQVDHVTRQNLGYPAHTSADNLEATAGGLHNGHTEGLCQAFVEEYLTSDQQLVPNLTLLQFSQHLDSILESVLLYHLLQQYPLGAISCYHKIYSNFSIITFTNKLFLAYYWYNFHYQVNTFSIN